MGYKTGITWTDHTFNPWIGCTKVSQGCKLCYAETQNNFYKWNPAGWGPGAPRKRTSPANWKKPLQWARQAIADGVIRRVFCASLADVFDDEAPLQYRTDLWELIGEAAYIGGLEWLILTKRPENIKEMMPLNWLHKPPEWIRLGVTAEDQQNADKRIPILLDAWKGKNFLSVEPMLGPVRLIPYLECQWTSEEVPWPKSWILPSDYPPMMKAARILPRVDWVICGGESGAGARPMHPDWARSIRDQCQAAGVPFFFKQWGEWFPLPPEIDDESAPDEIKLGHFRNEYHNRNGEYCGWWDVKADYGESWRYDADPICFAKVGKKRAGRLLDGREWNEFPEEVTT